MALGLSRLLVPLSKSVKGANTTDLLNAHGFVHQVGSGIYDLLPLGLRVQQKTENIIRKRLGEVGCVELLLSTLVDPNLWRKSGRLKDGPDANTEYMFTDGKKHIMAPTGEEQITTLVGKVSYKQLPLQLYQISKKFRNELRPRGGLLRTREFVMKDLYSFHETQEESMEAYEDIRGAYKKIFEDLKVPFVVAQADSGNIGGSLSHEFHFLSPDGEDRIVHCDNCGYTSNIECATSKGPTESNVETVTDKIEGVDVQYLKGRVVNPLLVKAAIQQNPSEIVDIRLPNGTAPIVEPQENDECSHCGHRLRIDTGIEVGHTFYLGKRYSEPLKSMVTHATGRTDAIEMGCFGIGVTRIVAAAAATLRDEMGLIWPRAIAPFDCIVVSSSLDTASSIAAELESQGIEAVHEDRTAQLGHAMRMAREAGWPILVIAGKKFTEEGLLEIQSRQSGESRLVPRDELILAIKELLA